MWFAAIWRGVHGLLAMVVSQNHSFCNLEISQSQQNLDTLTDSWMWSIRIYSLWLNPLQLGIYLWGVNSTMYLSCWCNSMYGWSCADLPFEFNCQPWKWLTDGTEEGNKEWAFRILLRQLPCHRQRTHLLGSRLGPLLEGGLPAYSNQCTHNPRRVVWLGHSCQRKVSYWMIPLNPRMIFLLSSSTTKW